MNCMKRVLFPNGTRALRGSFLLLGLILMMPLSAFSQGTDLIFGQKETFGIGPRSMGMGNAFVAVADDASAAYWNVAGLSQLTAYEIAISSAPVYFQDNVNGAPAFGFPWYGSIQFMMPIAQDNTLGISLFRPFHYQIDFFAGNPTLTPDQRAENSYLLNPSFQQSVIALSYAARFSAVKNFSVGLSVKRFTNDPYYIRYFGSDPLLQQQLQTAKEVSGYGVDVGLLYRIPITKYTEEFRIGLALNDIAGTNASYSQGITYGPTSAAVSQYNGDGFQTPVPPEIILGIAYKNDYLFKVRNITAIDFDQISDPRFDGNNNKIIRFGTEFWFLKDVLGIRGGYSSFISRPGFIHLGMSLRALNGDFEADAAYIQPIAPSASVTAGSAVGTYSTGGINFEPFYLGLTYRFGNKEEAPPPKVSAFVRPGTFSPSQGEKATFYLDTTEDIPIARWSVLIYDSSNHLVRALRGVASPPTKLVWGGENDQYEPLAPGVYTWAFQVQDQLEHIGSTPVQTAEILGPPAASQPGKDPSQLLAMRQQQAGLLAQERQQLSTLAQQSLQQLLGIEPKSSTTNASATPQPVDASGNTLYPAMGLGFKNLTPGEALNSHVEKGTDGSQSLVISYKSKLTYVPYLQEEAAGVIKEAVNSVGPGFKDFKEIKIRVYYGQNGGYLEMTTPIGVAVDYAAGKTDLLKLKELSEIHINGIKVGSNGY